MLLKRTSGQTRPDRALPLDLRLQAIAGNIPTASIDELWVFPPLPDRDIACEFVVIVCFDGGADRRRILTCHVDAEFADPESEEFEWVQRVREQGTATQRYIADIPDRLLGRLAEAGTPQVIEVGGRAEAWEEALVQLANGNGNGSGNGNGRAVALGAAQIDSALKREISFSTIIESPSFESVAPIDYTQNPVN
jgi:hypothetical protein